jgi:hypothetical protein
MSVGAKVLKPDCYQCRHRGSVPGSAHSCCKHPKNAKALEDPFSQLVSIFSSVGRSKPIIAVDEAYELAVQLNPHGVFNHWANWPFDFDPIWVNACGGFESK